MRDAPLVIDVAASGRVFDPGHSGHVVVVEPIYGCPAVALALEAGWDSVEVADELPVQPPIPLVSYEQPRPAGSTADRCRVRARDLHLAARIVADVELALLGCPANARPLASMLAGAAGSAITLVLAASNGADEQSRESLPLDGMWAAGVLIRVLLEELDARATQLTDAAGIAVTLARGAEEPMSQLSAGVRWRRHLEGGGHADDLRLASAIDSIGVVPQVGFEGDSIVARTWSPGS